MGYHYDIQRRRARRLLALKKINRLPYSSMRNSSDTSFEQRLKSRFIVRTVVSIFLLIIVYLIFQTSHSYAIKTKTFIEQVLTKEYNFSGINAWYQEKFAGNSAIIPSFNILQKEQKDKITFASPISVAPLGITEAQLGIYLATSKNQPVTAIQKGLVTYIGDSTNLGKTIMIRHEYGYESIYALVSRIDVEKDEWVEPGQIIGIVDQKLYFSIKDENKYLQPLEVIVFD